METGHRDVESQIPSVSLLIILYRTSNNIDRVKLPKSFLAVNLSDSHTFHKKEDYEEPPAAAGKELEEYSRGEAKEDGESSHVDAGAIEFGTPSE